MAGMAGRDINDQNDEAAEVSVFRDITLTSNCNMKMAEILSSHIRDNENYQLRVRQQAQRPDAIRLMAELIYTAPKAAAEILEILLVIPKVKDNEHHPIMNRTDLRQWSKLFELRSMRTTYQDDVANKTEDSVVWPEYNFKTETSWKPAWHDRFMPPPKGTDGRIDSVYDCTVKTLLLKKCMSIDILWALSRTWDIHRSIFQKIPIQGIITCVWDNLICDVYLLDLCFQVFELVALVTWGLWDSGQEEAGKTQNSPVMLPVAYSILVATALKEWFCFGWALKMYTKRGHAFEHAFERALEKSDRAGYAALWQIKEFFYIPLHNLIETVLLSCLLFLTYMFADQMKDMNTLGEVCIAANIFARFWKLLNDLRPFTGLGKSVLAILGSMFCETMRELFVVAGACFCTFSVVFYTLQRDRTYAYIVINVYRTLMFGDGDGLNVLGMKGVENGAVPQDDEDDFDTWDYNATSKMDDIVVAHTSQMYHHYAMTGFCVMSTIMFSIIIVNLIIAVYGKEYDGWEERAPLLFQRVRAQYSVKYLLQFPNIAEYIEDVLSPLVPEEVKRHKENLEDASQGTGQNWCERLQMQAGRRHESLVIFLLIFMGVGLAAFFRDPKCISMALTAGGLIAAGEILWFAAWLRTPWYPRATEAESTWDRNAFDPHLGKDEQHEHNPHFLWICHRADFDEDLYKEDDVSQNMSELQSNLRSMVDERFGQLKQNVQQSVSEHLDVRLQQISTLMVSIKEEQKELLRELNLDDQQIG